MEVTDEIYLDNSATTKLCQGAVDSLARVAGIYGNPSSLHKMGNDAQKLIDGAREDVCSALALMKGPLNAASDYRPVFTSCGTESNNLALFGVINAKSFKFLPRVITTDSEHPSILNALRALEKQKKAEIVLLSTKGGVIERSALLEAINERTVLVSIMHVNNETGAIYPVKELFTLAKERKPDIITHSDMTQSFLKLSSDGPYAKLGADLITVSAHKVHAPKGVAALAIREELIKRKRIVPIMQGGGQQGGFRSGTENVMGILAFGAACKEGLDCLRDGLENRFLYLRQIFVSSLDSEIKVNVPERFAPHIISLTMPKIKSQTVLSFLSENGIYVSSGSACSSNKPQRSYVLDAFGLTPTEADCTVRVSLCRYNTENEMIRAAKALNCAARTLIQFK